jgi:transcriptional regulator with XRE-family HTH domain
MPKKPNKPSRSWIQEAIIKMRQTLNYSQMDLAVAMKQSLITIARWETSREPSDEGLWRLSDFASQHSLDEFSYLFRSAWEQNFGGLRMQNQTHLARVYMIALIDILDSQPEDTAPILRAIFLTYKKLMTTPGAKVPLKSAFDPADLKYRVRELESALLDFERSLKEKR